MAEDAGKSGYKVSNIVLLDSKFWRKSNIDFSRANNFDNSVDIKNSHVVRENKELLCSVELTYTSLDIDEKIVEAKITMIGLFEKVGEPELTFEQFGKINAPAIIFPFIREHLASLSAKGAMSTIMIPPVNFVALAESAKK